MNPVLEYYLRNDFWKQEITFPCSLFLEKKSSIKGDELLQQVQKLRNEMPDYLRAVTPLKESIELVRQQNYRNQGLIIILEQSQKDLPITITKWDLSVDKSQLIDDMPPHEKFTSNNLNELLNSDLLYWDEYRPISFCTHYLTNAGASTPHNEGQRRKFHIEYDKIVNNFFNPNKHRTYKKMWLTVHFARYFQDAIEWDYLLHCYRQAVNGSPFESFNFSFSYDWENSGIDQFHFGLKKKSEKIYKIYNQWCNTLLSYHGKVAAELCFYNYFQKQTAKKINDLVNY